MNLTDLIIPPWAKLVGALLPIVALAGAYGWLDHSRNHWKSQDATDKVTISQRDATIAALRTQIRGMTTAQDSQGKITTLTVDRVVQGPERVRTVVQHIHDAPIPPKCETPDLPYLRSHT